MQRKDNRLKKKKSEKEASIQEKIDNIPDLKIRSFQF